MLFLYNPIVLRLALVSLQASLVLQSTWLVTESVKVLDLVTVTASETRSGALDAALGVFCSVTVHRAHVRVLVLEDDLACGVTSSL